MLRKVFFAPQLLVAFTLVGLFALTVLPVEAQGVGTLTLRVDCDKGDSIQETIKKSWEHTTIEVFGTCNEHVDIDKDRIRLIGRPGAKLSAPSGLSSVISIRGRIVEVKDFEIDADGVWNGILVLGGGYAMINGNEIRNTSGDGIMVRDGSVADIYDNKILRSTYMGVSLYVGASANIVGNTIEESGNVGIIFGGSEASIIDNKIINNGAGGIWIGGNSSASINSNIIEGNTHSGVGVVESGSADLAGNTIRGNGLAGVSVERNSSITMPPWAGGANLIEGNNYHGILCGNSGSMIGIPQNFGSGNTPADELIDPGCDKIGF